MAFHNGWVTTVALTPGHYLCLSARRDTSPSFLCHSIPDRVVTNAGVPCHSLHPPIREICHFSTRGLALLSPRAEAGCQWRLVMCESASAGRFSSSYTFGLTALQKAQTLKAALGPVPSWSLYDNGVSRGLRGVEKKALSFSKSDRRQCQILGQIIKTTDGKNCVFPVGAKKLSGLSWQGVV